MSRRLTPILMASPPVLLVVLFVGLPVVNAVGLTLGYTGGLNQTIARIGLGTHETHSWAPTFGAYQEVLSTPRFWSDLLVTVAITLLVTTVVVLVAWALALFMRLTENPFNKIMPTLAVVPMFIPGVIGAWAALTFWSSDGFIGSVLRSVGLPAPQIGFTSGMVVIAQTWESLPFAVLMLTSAISSVPQALIDASRDSGASTVQTVFRVILPMTAVPTVIAVTFTAISVIGSFTVPYLTGPSAPSMLGVTMTRYFQAYGQPQQAVVMAIMVFGMAAALGVLYVWSNWRSAKEEL